MIRIRSGGFSLIELMITVVIIGVIAAIALPSYAQYVQKTRRTNAQSDLLELAAYMERLYGERFSYAGANLPFIQSPKDGGSKYYDLAIVASDSDSFTLSATPKNSQVGDRCGTMTINQTGSHTAAKSDCW
ncbi:type IV pilin protein [Methylophaga sp.]|uniref:type IV pilin protein n=1 Tax=Methylophaga sp. TaxID=2024840 RepID=UPI003F696AEB